MRLIPLLIVKLTPLSTETAIKYFLAQAIASLIIIFSRLNDRGLTFSRLLGTQNEIILIALCVKAGIAPFHFWFPQVIKIAAWPQCVIILTWQKIAPFVLISSAFRATIATIVIISSAAVGSVGGLNQMRIKNILTYSSIAHSAWMLAICSASSVTSWAAYFIIYSTISVTIILMLYKTRTSTVPQLISSNWRNTAKISFMTRFLSLGGLPPFLGFLAKLRAIQLILTIARTLTVAILILSSLVSLYYYTRVVYLMLLKTGKVNIVITPHYDKLSLTISTLAIAGNVIIPSLVLLV